MSNYLTYEAQKHANQAVLNVNDPLVVEQPLAIKINGEALSVTMQTPGDEIDLVIGLLYSEDIFRKDSALLNFKLTKNKNGIIDEIDIVIPESAIGKGYMNSRQLLSVSSCGICGRTQFEPRVGEKLVNQNLDAAFLSGTIQRLAENQSLFKETGGCHGVAAFGVDGELLVLREDIGRHNATDKVIGALLQQRKLKEAKILSVSGRVSYEIVSKCFMAGISTLVAVSAPSTLAVDYCKELGITLAAFCRDDRITLYT